MVLPWFPPDFQPPSPRRRDRAVHPDALLAALADCQHGIVTRRQLQALGLSPDRIRARVRRGSLHRLGAGVYVVGRRSRGPVGERMAAVLAAGHRAVLADLSGAAQHGAVVPRTPAVHVIVPPGRMVARAGIHTRAAFVPDHEQALVDGIPCLTMPRVLLDVAAHRDRRTLENLWHEAVYRRLVHLPAVARVLREHHGERGTVELRRLHDRRLHAVGDVANRMGAEMREILVEAGIPEPRANVRITIEGVSLKPDLYVAERRLAVETDGRDGHADPERQASDARRDALYRRAGITPYRYGWWQVHYERSRVLAEVVCFEAAWQRTGGRWTHEMPAPAMGVGRRR